MEIQVHKDHWLRIASSESFNQNIFFYKMFSKMIYF